MMTGNAFSIRIGSALSLALAPQIKISVIQSTQKVQVHLGDRTGKQLTGEDGYREWKALIRNLIKGFDVPGNEPTVPRVQAVAVGSLALFSVRT